MFQRNAESCLRIYKAPKSRKIKSSSSPPWEPKISLKKCVHLSRFLIFNGDRFIFSLSQSFNVPFLQNPSPMTAFKSSFCYGIIYSYISNVKFIWRLKTPVVVLWVMTQCGLVCGYESFEGKYHLDLQGKNIKSG